MELTVLLQLMSTYLIHLNIARSYKSFLDHKTCFLCNLVNIKEHHFWLNFTTLVWPLKENLWASSKGALPNLYPMQWSKLWQKNPTKSDGHSCLVCALPGECSFFLSWCQQIVFYRLVLSCIRAGKNRAHF